MRNPRFNALIGSPGSGKSTYTANAIKVYRRPVIVIKHTVNIHDEAFSFLPIQTMESYKGGKCKMAVSTRKEYVEVLKWAMNTVRDALIVVDDATIYERDRISAEMGLLLAMRRHYGIEIWMVYHGFTWFPIDQFLFVNHLVIFNTNDEIGYKKNKIPEYEKIQEAIDVSRERFKKLKQNNPERYKPTTVTLST